MYYHNVHPILPFLPLRSTLNSLALTNTSTDNNLSEPNLVLLLALCAYTGKLSPSSATSASTSSLSGLGIDNAGKIAADLWYEQARTTLESVQTLILCALRDHGRGGRYQMWIGYRHQT